MRVQPEKLTKRRLKGKRARTKKRARKIRSYPPEFRLRAVLMHVKEGWQQADVARELGVSATTVGNRVRARVDSKEEP